MYYDEVLPGQLVPLIALGSAIADMDGDGFVDLLLAPFRFQSESTWGGGIFWNDGSGDFSDVVPTQIIPTPGIPETRFGSAYAETPPVAVDIDGDGDLDLLQLYNGGHYDDEDPDERASLQVLVNQGGRVFADETVSRVGPLPHNALPIGWVVRLDTPDINGDACPDLVLFRPPPAGNPNPLADRGHVLWLNDCLGRFSPVENAVLGKIGFRYLPFDIEPDGDIDFLVSRADELVTNLGETCLPDEGSVAADYHDFAILENVRPARAVLFDDRFESGDQNGWSAAAGAIEVLREAAYEGGYGLRATAESSCTSPNEVVLDGETLTGGLHEACAFLYAAATEVTGNVTFRSGQTISLGPGLTVATTGTLTTEIVPAIFSLAYVQDDTPAAETTFGAQFTLRLDALSLGETNEIGLFSVTSAAGFVELELILQRSGADNRLYPRVHLDNGTHLYGTPFVVPDGWHTLWLRWEAADLDEDNGFLDVYLDDTLETSLTALDNDFSVIDRLRLGIVSGIDASSSGFIDLDLFEWWR